MALVLQACGLDLLTSFLVFFPRAYSSLFGAFLRGVFFDVDGDQLSSKMLPSKPLHLPSLLGLDLWPFLNSRVAQGEGMPAAQVPLGPLLLLPPPLHSPQCSLKLPQVQLPQLAILLYPPYPPSSPFSPAQSQEILSGHPFLPG